MNENRGLPCIDPTSAVGCFPADLGVLSSYIRDQPNLRSAKLPYIALAEIWPENLTNYRTRGGTKAFGVVPQKWRLLP